MYWVVKVEVYGLRLPEVKCGDDLVQLILECASGEAGGLEDGDIVVVTSKIVSKAYGFLVKLDEINPSKKALKIAEKSGGDACFIQAVLDNSDEILFVLPFSKLVQKDVISMEKMSKNLSGAYLAMSKAPYLLIVRRGGQIYSDAGLDSSNHPEGVVSVPPRDLTDSPERLRKTFRS